jgi:para-aminobenzoate synthetase component I
MTIVIALDQALSPREAFIRLGTLPRPALLQSTAPTHPLGRYSYFAADPVTSISGHASSWPALRERLRSTTTCAVPHDPLLPPFQGGWAGWFSYELGAAFDRMPVAAADPFAVPDVSLGLYDWVISWDHQEQRCWLLSSGVDADGACDDHRAHNRAQAVLALLSNASAPAPSLEPAPHELGLPSGLKADFTPAEYRAAVARVIEYILAGDIFQANLSQRFTAPFAGDRLALLDALGAVTPSPLGAYLAAEEVEVFSASPERFLQYDPRTRVVDTRPIKGTRPRSSDAQRDTALAEELVGSEKDRAENVMIVDLLRNDLSKVCEAGSVEVDVLCRLETHATVHHLVSEVRGRLRSSCDALDLLAATFPGGSVTGAPKLRATAILAELERVRRGVYCGAIGWLGLDGGLDLNLAIRTIIVKDGVAAIHAGGGVTARSLPDEEYRETLDKARGLISALAAAT